MLLLGTEPRYVSGQFIMDIVYIYSAQYLNILHDSKHYITCPAAQMQPKLPSH